MNSIIKTSKENICFNGSNYVTHEIIKGVDLPIYSLKIYFRSGISTVTCWLSYHEAVSLSNEIDELMKEFKRGEEAVKKRKTFQERLDEEQAKRKYADMLKEKLDIDEQAAQSAAKQAYDLKQHDHQRTREIEEEVMKKQKPKAYTLDEVKDEMIGEKGTTERDKYEKRLLINLFAEKVANICKEVVPEYIVKDNGNEYRFTFDMYDLRKKVFEARDQFLADIEAKEKVHAPL